MSDNQVFKCGEYFDWEKGQIEERLKFIEDFKPHMPTEDDSYDIISDQEVLEFNKRWNPYDRLYNDLEYARSQGLTGVPVMPGFIHRRLDPIDESMPHFRRDIGSNFYYTALGGDQYYYKRVCSGDELIKCQITPHLYELTKEHSDVRVWEFETATQTYNKAGQVIDRSVYKTREGYQKFTDGRIPQDYNQNMSEWRDYFPQPHYTTDEDYEKIRELWKQEEIRGEKPLYWEDVEIGTEVPKTCSDGPVTYMHIVAWEPIPPEYLFTREELSDPEYLQFVYRDKNGAYIDETAKHFGGENYPNGRAVFYNTDAAFLIARTITNYIGNQGRISRFGWMLYPFFEKLRIEKLGIEMFNRVPGMEGRYCNRHGAEGDTVIGRAVVIGKYINAEGEHVVEFALWAETLDGDIIQVCPTEAVLPSRNDI